MSWFQKLGSSCESQQTPVCRPASLTHPPGDLWSPSIVLLRCFNQEETFPGAELTISVHQPQDSETWMHSPQDCALALMHTLPSASTQKTKVSPFFTSASPNSRAPGSGSFCCESPFQRTDRSERHKHTLRLLRTQAQHQHRGQEAAAAAAAYLAAPGWRSAAPTTLPRTAAAGPSATGRLERSEVSPPLE